MESVGGMHHGVDYCVQPLPECHSWVQMAVIKHQLRCCRIHYQYEAPPRGHTWGFLPG
jgi:hypothetical protein